MNKKMIPIKNCGECETYCSARVTPEDKKVDVCLHPDNFEKEVDPSTLHKDCPFDDLPEEKKETVLRSCDCGKEPDGYSDCDGKSAIGCPYEKCGLTLYFLDENEAGWVWSLK